MNKIIIYSLDGCSYSQYAINTLKYNNIDYQVIHIDKDDKEYYKITHNINSFPHILYLNKNDDKYKIGGNDDLNEIFKIINDTKENTTDSKALEKFNIMVDTIQSKLSLDKKTTLQLIDLLK
jgi:glutaredoxin